MMPIVMAHFDRNGKELVVPARERLARGLSPEERHIVLDQREQALAALEASLRSTQDRALALMELVSTALSRREKGKPLTNHWWERLARAAEIGEYAIDLFGVASGRQLAKALMPFWIDCEASVYTPPKGAVGEEARPQIIFTAKEEKSENLVAAFDRVATILARVLQHRAERMVMENEEPEE